MRVIASQKMSRDSGESIFAARHQDVSQGPLGRVFGEPVVCTPDSRGFGHFRGCRDCRDSIARYCDAIAAIPHIVRYLFKEDSTPPPCPSFPCFFGKWPGQPPKKTRIFYAYRTPQIPGKEGKSAQKNKEFSQKKKKQGIPKNKER